MSGLAVRAALAALLVATPALARDGSDRARKLNFTECDGYDIPSAKADGMTGAGFLWRVNPDDLTARNRIGYAQTGIDACTAALADPNLLPGYWRRRVNLLQSRARHQLEAGNSQKALADLDLASAAIVDANDPYFARSQAVSLDYLRAFALAASGDQGGADAIAMRLMAARPYSRLSAYATSAIVGPKADDGTLENLEREMTRLQPRFIETLYARFTRQGRWAELIALYPQLTTPVVRTHIGRGFWAREFETVELVQSNMTWIQRSGVYAYALASQGRDAEARAALAAARARLQVALVPDAPAPPESVPSQQKIIAAAMKLKTQQTLREQGEPALALWEALIERRISIDRGGAAAIAASLVAKPAPRNVLGREFLTALLARLKADPDTPTETVQAIAAMIPPPPPGAVTTPPEPLTAQLFADALPLPQAASSMPDYRKAFSGLLGNGEGFSSFKPSQELVDDYGADVVGLSFRTLGGNAEVAEEMALLRAADLALEAGKDGLVILYRRDVQVIEDSYYYAQVVASYPAGYSTSLNVVFVDRDALPERLKDAAWRVIDARAVYAALAPIYIRPEPGKPTP